ncbi:acylphosphatase [Propionibacterium freudenreichii]|uniref:acylphosphatase n=1 Tax=Propionibacterium freudenreichii TaxID=1744 RepID=UPI002551ACC6|nr:acylphosphatase [Propionibacterium freudenreichii]MDK9294947.1 acylphosphatase [Propionibacterium freudenreichii]MDK9347395.1 acylphosphatase [Propionibacterium freudenreichii]MDK9360268.1 acylphosphatase [Propionibacterium freudenreichii]
MPTSAHDVRSQRAVHLIASGRVQGVGYRWQAREQARALGIDGWVKNRGDGRVEMVAQGERRAVGRFIAWARSGPGYGHVDDLEVTEEEPRGITGFDVR